VAEAAEAAMLLVVSVLNIIDAAAGHSFQQSNGIALIVFELIVVAGLAWIAAGLVQVRPWSRTPAAMTQAFTIIVAIILLQAHRFDWGSLALLFALAGLAGLLAPPSLRALSRPAPGADKADKAGVTRRS
jgi:carbon starvation protein CstA